MEQDILTLEEFKDIWEQCTQKLLSRLSAIIKMDLKEVIEEDKTETEAVSNVDLKTTCYKTDMEKDVTVDLQMKLAVLIIKWDIQITDQKSDLDNFLILDLQKRQWEEV